MKNILRKSLLTRIVFYMLIIGIVPLLFLGLATIFSIGNVLKNEAINSQNENVKQGTLYINLVMDDVESLIANVSGIDEVNNILSSSSAETSYEKLTTQAKIGYILSGYTNLKGLVSIDLFSHDGAHYHVGETLNVSNINQDLINKLFTETHNSDGFVNWSGIDDNINLDSEFPTVITATKILNAKGNTGNSDSSSALLVISYDPEVFKEELGGAADPSSYSILLDSKNRIVYHPNPQLIGQTISAELSGQINQAKKGVFTQLIDGKSMLVIFDSTQKGDWTVVKFIPLANILSSANTMTVVFIGLVLVSITITGIFGILISKQIIRPIKKVTDTFRLLQSGDFVNWTKLTLVHQEDEIGELGKLFNSFIEAREDITIQKKLEKQLNEQNKELNEALMTLKVTQTQMIQQEKMAGIGQLAAGVAHEINNPLGFVTSNFSVLDKYVGGIECVLKAIDTNRHIEGKEPDDLQTSINKVWNENSIDSIRSDLTEIISDTQEGLIRIADIVNALKTFSRTSMLEERYVYDLNEGIRTTLLIANNEIKYNCIVKFKQDQIPKISANGGQINQVLLNIIVNATQAIKQKKQQEKGIIEIISYVENDDICCEIKDNGCGMTPDVMNRIFEPFFTTKPVGQGTGLGLSLAYDIVVNKHGGKFEVSSEFGVGTSFRILIPMNQNRVRDV